MLPFSLNYLHLFFYPEDDSNILTPDIGAKLPDYTVL